ncbi:MAG: hypothetical protein GX465_19270 [Acidobacteria bacterium]|nr:hypothetical protein [Acidobacteriota bacterium]
MNYIHPTHGEVFVARGLAGLYITAYRVPSGAIRRLKSPMMPAVPDPEIAQANLDRWATAAKLGRM